MSVFSNHLQELFQQTGLSVYAMSKACGVERTFLHKILNGTRMPASEGVVERIANALRLDPAQAQVLYRQYQVCRDGEEAVERRGAVERLLTGLSLPNRESRFEVRRQVDVQALPPTATDRGTVLRLLKLLLEVEAARPEGRIHLFCASEDEFLWQLLGMYLDNRPDLPVRQLVCLRSGGTHQALLHNLELLRQTLPLALSGADYQAAVCYGERPPALMLPNLLLTSRYALQFSQDFSYGLLCDDPERVGLFHTLMERQLAGCHPLIRPMGHPLQLLEHYTRINEAFEGSQLRLFALSPDPCLVPFLTPRLLDEHLSGELQDPAAKDLILAYIAQARRMLEHCQVTHYFTPRGLSRFVETGRLTELPQGFYTPLSPAACRGMLADQLELAGRCPGYTPLALDGDRLGMPDRVMVETAANGALSLVYAHPEAGLLAFVLDEPALCNALFDYLESLRQSRCVAGREESLALLRRAAEGAAAL